MGVVPERTEQSDRELQQTLFEVLSNQRRRFAVYAMSGTQEVSLGSLAEQIAAWENEQPVDAVSSAERKRVYTALQQSHLPKLAEAGLIEYDDRAGVIRPQSELEAYDVYMEVVSDREIPWSEYYLGLAGVAGAVTASIWIGVWPFTALPVLAWMGVLTLAFAASAVAHILHTNAATLGGDGSPPEVTIDD